MLALPHDFPCLLVSSVSLHRVQLPAGPHLSAKYYATQQGTVGWGLEGGRAVLGEQMTAETNRVRGEPCGLFSAAKVSLHYSPASALPPGEPQFSILTQCLHRAICKGKLKSVVSSVDGEQLIDKTSFMYRWKKSEDVLLP